MGTVHKMELVVEGMHCKSCKMLVEDILSDLGAKNIKVKVDETKRVGFISCNLENKREAVRLIENEGYKVK